MEIILLVITLFFLLLFLKIPIGISMGISSTLGFLLMGYNVASVGSLLYTSVSSVALSCIPGYIVAGALMAKGGIADALIKAMRAWIGHLPGGMAIVGIICCTFFAAITGSTAATIAAVGGIMIPALIEYGYDEEFSMGCIAGAGTLGILIPPSIPMVLYATMSTGVSVSKMFSAGMLPGLMVVLAYSIYSTVYAKKHHLVAERTKVKDRWGVTLRAIPALLLPVLILGSIYGGIMTATESAAFACVYAFIVSVCIYRGFTLESLGKCIFSAAKTTSNIYFVIVGGALLAQLLTLLHIPQMVVSFCTDINVSPSSFIFICCLILLILGCFLEGTAIMLICTPLMFPVVSSMNINIYQFGVIMTIGLMVGQVTPPVGGSLFMVSSLQKKSVAKVVKGSLPFLAMLVISWVVVCMFPSISTFLPSLIKAGT